MQPEQQQPEQTQEQASGVGAFIWDLVKVLIISALIIVPIRYFVAQPFIVSGISMEPNFHNGEYLIINELSYKLGEQPQRGDIVVFKYPRDNSQYFIKRIIGLPGETVQVINGSVKVYNAGHPQGFMLDEKVYLSSNNMTFGSDQPVMLGKGEFYVLGDNRQDSSDSRYWGILPRNDIIGKVFVRAYPLQSFTKFSAVNYQN